MVSRKHRIPVVLDTNVFVRAFKSRSVGSPNRRILQLWLLERRLQLILSDDLIDEYLGIFDTILGMGNDLIEDWRRRFTSDPRSTVVGLGRRYSESRDPDDNLLLAIATAGQISYLVTNDRDLLDLPTAFLQTLRYEVVAPKNFLESVLKR